MANVGFKRGDQGLLNSYRGLAAADVANPKAAIDGCFYLTDDTHRLYIGDSTGTLHAVNEGVITVSNVGALPTSGAHQGEFYYATSENVLCVYSGSRWVQINAVVRTNKLADTVTGNTATNTATVATTLGQSDNSQELAASFSIIGQDGVKIDVNGTDIKVTADVASLSADVENGKATLTLGHTLDKETDSEVKIVPGAHTTISKNDAGEIVIGASHTSVQGGTLSINNAVNGAVSGNGYVVSVSGSDGVALTKEFDPQIKYGSGTTNTIHFVDNTATLDVYTTAQVDNKISTLTRQMDSMTYQGAISGSDELPTTGVKVGDSYKLAKSLNYQGTTYPAGTLAIARGTEDTTGVITLATLEWDFITGSVADTTYKFGVVDNGITLNSSGGATTGTLLVAAGTAMAVSNTKDESNNKNTITVSHGNIASTKTAETKASQKKKQSIKVSAVTDVTVNEQGHVTEVKTKEYEILDTNTSLDAVTMTVDSTATQASFKTVVAVQDGAGAGSSKDGTVSLTSSSLTFGTATGAGSTTIDMVWGSF